MLDSETNLSTDMAVSNAKNFLRTMAQPFKAKDQEGISTWSLADIERHEAKRKAEEARMMREELTNGHKMDAVMTSAIEVVEDEFDDDIDEDLMMLDAQ
jgi:DNA excision repair protein ERCC-2